MKKLFIISISAILGMFTQIDSSYAAGNCGIGSLDTSTDNTDKGFAYLNDIAGYNESKYGLTTGSGQWAREFSYGTVWGMAKCSETAGNNSSNTWPESSKSDWLKTPSDTAGGYCWCQATGFTASGNNYTSGPQCTTTASSSWVFLEAIGSFDYCVRYCPPDCAGITLSAFRTALFGAAGVVPPSVGLTWYDNGTTISGASSCTVGGTFVPPTPSARTGYIFAGWKIKHYTSPTCGIDQLDVSINGNSLAYGYSSFNAADTGSNESDYGLTPGSGQWAVEFSYGTVWGMGICDKTKKSTVATITSPSSGANCWCQVTGFSPSGSDYTSGPQCTVSSTSSTWVYASGHGYASFCKSGCLSSCVDKVSGTASFRGSVFGAVGQ